MEDAIVEENPNDLPSCQPLVPSVLAEFLCRESLGDELMKSETMKTGSKQHTVQSYLDPNLLHHSKAIGRLRLLESTMDKPRDYSHSTTKDDILSDMRKIVASWMLEVCVEQRCDEAVFPLSVALLDKFLGRCQIKKDQLQLVACVCLLLASKTRQGSQLSLELLSWYTNNSVSPESLRSWELLMLSQLNWDVNIVTANDFVDFFLMRNSWQPGLDNQLLRRHATTFIALCSTEPRFVTFKPSLIAASAIYTVMKGFLPDDNKIVCYLAYMAAVTLEQLISISLSIDQVIGDLSPK